MPQQREPKGETIDVAELIDIPEDALSLLPPLRRDCVVVYLTDPSRTPRSLLEMGRILRGSYLLLPLDVASQSTSVLRESGILMPVFGFGEDKLFLTDTIIVRFDEDKSEADIAHVLNAAGAISHKALLGPPNLYSCRLPAGRISETAALSYTIAQHPDVRYAEPNWLALVKHNSADPFYGQQWGLHNTGQPLCDPVPRIVSDSDVDAPEAWEITVGSTNILVAVLDNGVEWDHPDLASSMGATHVWYDAVDDDADPRPSPGDYHGTSIAGIIAAVQSNSLGVTGVAPGSRVMPVRIAQGSGGEWVMEIEWAVNGIGWAWQKGASVLNLSWSMGTPPLSIRDALTTALTSGRSGKGCVVVVASGNNDGAISDFPANMPELFTVGASSPADERKSPTSVDGETYWGSAYDEPLDCVAPGVKIYTTDHTGSKGKSTNDYNCRFNGTSAAAPFASAIAALVLSVDSELLQQEVVAIMTKSAERVGGYSYAHLKTNGVWDKEMGYGRLNAHRAVAMAQGADYDLPQIVHTPLPGQTNNGPFTLVADITDSTGIDAGVNAPRLYYRIGVGAWTSTTDSNGPDGSTYSFRIPFVPQGSTVDYYFAAQDLSPQHNTITLPFGGGSTSPPGTTAPGVLFSFLVDPNAGVITVNDNGPADYSSIQSAINAASYGDTIKVAGGVYHEALSLTGKSGLTVSGGYSEDFQVRSCADYPSVIDAKGTATVASFFDCTGIAFDGFTLINGNGNYVFGIARWAGGFIVKGGSGMHLSHLVVSNCTAYVGGGGVIYQTDACVFEFSRLLANRATSGGSAFYVRECSPMLNYVEASRNTSSSDARAVQFYYAGGEFRNATVVDNTAVATYAISMGVSAVSSSSRPSLKNCIIKHNYNSNGVVENNLNTYQFASVSQCHYAVGEGAGHPAFLDRPGGHYQLREGSVGIDMGANWGQTKDLGGNTVPWGAAPDIGAYEHRPDLDGDGLMDIDEVDRYGTSPFEQDSDGDGMPDGWEVSYSLNPLADDAQANRDADPFDNLSEYISGTSPTDPSSYFRVHDFRLATNALDLTISWQAATGRVYTVHSTTSLLSGTWSPTSFTNFPGVNGTMSYTTGPLGRRAEFYKVSVDLKIEL